MRVLVIYRKQGFAVLDNNEVVEFRQLYDEWGDETDDPDTATKAIAPMASGSWILIHFGEFTDVTLH